MLDLYLRLRHHQTYLQQQQQELDAYHPTQQHNQYPLFNHNSRQDRSSQQDVPINLTTTSCRQNVDRTYTELQNVRPGIAGDASEVLRRHIDDDDLETSPVPGNSGTSQLNDHRVVECKEELILPQTPSYQDSVMLQSVRPAPASVSVVSTQRSSYVPASGMIGRGIYFISAQYQNSTIGPIYVETEHELKAVNALIQEKVGEFKAKAEKGLKQLFIPSGEGELLNPIKVSFEEFDTYKVLSQIRGNKDGPAKICQP